MILFFVRCSCSASQHLAQMLLVESVEKISLKILKLAKKILECVSPVCVKEGHFTAPLCFSFSTFSHVMLDSQSHKEFTVCLLCAGDNIPQMDLCGGNSRLLWGCVQYRQRPATALLLCLLKCFLSLSCGQTRQLHSI